MAEVNFWTAHYSALLIYVDLGVPKSFHIKMTFAQVS